MIHEIGWISYFSNWWWKGYKVAKDGKKGAIIYKFEGFGECIEIMEQSPVAASTNDSPKNSKSEHPSLSKSTHSTYLLSDIAERLLNYHCQGSKEERN